MADNGMYKILQKLNCEHAWNKFQREKITPDIVDLPSHVFESILPCLSAKKLQEVQETSSKSGVDFEKVWKQHIRTRWQMGVQTVMNVFHQQDLQPDYYIVYMMQHFHDILDVCTTHTFKMPLDPHQLYICPLHKLPSKLSEDCSTTQSSTFYQSELVRFSTYVLTLRVTGAQCSWICSHLDLFTRLLDTTQRIQIVSLTRTYFSVILSTLSLFITYGKLKAAVFSACKLSRQHLKDLMYSVSGHLDVTDAGGRLGHSLCDECLLKSRKCLSTGRYNNDIKNTSISMETGLTVNHVTESKLYSSHVTNKFCTSDHVTNKFCTSDHVTSKISTSDHVTSKFCTSDHVKETVTPADQVEENLSRHKNLFEQNMPSSIDDDVDIYKSDDDEICEHENAKVRFSSNHVDDSFKEKLEDLFDEALTPMEKITSQVRNSGILLHPNSITTNGKNQVSHCKICYCIKCRSLYHGKDEKNIILTEEKHNGTTAWSQGLHNLEDKEGTRFTDEALIGRKCPERKRRQGGLESVAILGTTDWTDISQTLIEILPSWTSLSKLGIFELGVNSAEAVDQIMKMLSRHQLSHLVLNDLNLHESFLRKLILTLHHHYKKGEISKPVIELLDFQSLSSALEFDGPLPVDVCLMGVKSLDLSMNYLDDTVFSGLLYLIRNDQALVHLKLQECSLTETNILQLLEILSGKKIRTLNMSGNVMETEEVEAALVKFMCRCESLTTLELNNISPRKNFIGSSHFIEAVVHHRSLTTLSLGNNHLGDEAVDFLKAVCCTDHRLSLKTLHIWFNWIKGESLLQAAHEIKKHHGNRGPVLDNLSITGNQMTYDLAQELCQVYSSIVKVLNAGRIEFSLPFAEYVAQM